MKKLFVALALLTALAIPVAAVGADLHNGVGSSCAPDIGVFHFVNNQTGGAAAGSITVTFDNGDVVTTGPSKVNQHTQHFIVESDGALETAETNLPGRLVLSDFSCEGDGKNPPPKK